MLTLIVGIGLLLDRAMVLDLGSMAKELSSETGKRIEVSRDLADRIVYLDQRGAGTFTTVRALATAVGADVQETSGGYRIFRSQETLKNLRSSIAKTRAGWIKNRIKQIRSIREEAARKGSLQRELSETIPQEIKMLHPTAKGSLYEPKITARMLLPEQELIMGIVERIGPENFASRPIDQNIVFESAVGQLSENLPNCEDLVAQYVKSAQDFSRFTLPNNVLKASEELHLREELEQMGRTIVAPERLRLDVLMDENEFIFSLEGYDGRGKRTLSSWLRCAPTEFHQASQSWVAHDRLDPEAEWFRFSPTAQEALKFSMTEDPMAVPSWYTDPCGQDPLEPFVKEALHALLKPASRQCVAAAVSDCLWLDVALCSKLGRLDVTALRKTMVEWSPWVTISQKDALVLRPLDPLIDEKNIANRKVLARYSKNILAGHPPDLQELARFYYYALPKIGQSVASANPLVGMWARIGFTSQGRAPFFGDMAPCLLRILGSMTDETWARLLEGKTVGLGSSAFRPELIAFLSQGRPVEKKRKFADFYNDPFEIAEAVGIENTTLDIRRSKEQVIKLWDHLAKKEPRNWGSESELQYSLMLPSGAIEWIQGEPVVKMTKQDFKSYMGKYSFRFANRVNDIVEIHLGPEASLIERETESTTDETATLSFGQLDEQTQTQLWNIASSGSVAMAGVVHGMAERARSAHRSRQSSNNPARMP